MKNEIILFENQNIKLEVNMKDETVWLNTYQIAELFDRDFKTIRKHIKNCLQEEIDGINSTVAKFATVQTEGNREVTREIEYYNLDVIISVGYRVKSKNGILFRKWANKILKEYLLKGYAINENRIKSYEKVVKLIDIASRCNDIKKNDYKEIINVINAYSNALTILDDYDYKRLSKIEGTIEGVSITYEDCLKIISELRKEMKSPLFALERDRGLSSIINDIYQTFDGEDVYKTKEEKAANLLYLVVKNHVFIDGNKRIAATLFIYYLSINNLLYNGLGYTIDNNTLAALTILIAQSKPVEKEVMIDLITNFLLGS